MTSDGVMARRGVIARMFRVALTLMLAATACSSSGSDSSAQQLASDRPAATSETATSLPAAATPTVPTVAPVPTATAELQPATPEATPKPIEPTATVVPAATAEPAATVECVRLSDFVSDGETARWRVVNDGVMGGLSSGGPTFTDSTMTFAGEINTNGGGFSSVRLDLLPGTLDGITRVLVRARTDGRTYKLTFEDALANRDRRISHQVDLVFDERDDWQVRVASFDDLRASLFGRAVVTEAFRPDLAIEMGVMISDGVDGPFQVDIDWIDVCS